MARRNRGHMNGERYLANASASKREVHDLDNEKTNCQIDESSRQVMTDPITRVMQQTGMVTITVHTVLAVRPGEE